MFNFKAAFGFSAFWFLINIGGAFSYTCNLSDKYEGIQAEGYGIYGASDITGCDEYTMKYLNFTSGYDNVNRYFRYQTCTKCKDGYWLNTISGETMPDATGGRCGYTYSACYAKQTCSNCESFNWATWNYFYQRKVDASCDYKTGTCSKNTYYRCGPGYYGTPTNEATGCTKCPKALGVFTNSARTVLADTISVTGTTDSSYCYLPDGEYYDAKGKFTSTCIIPRGSSPLNDWTIFMPYGAKADFDWGSTNVFGYCASSSNTKPTRQDECTYKFCICVPDDGNFNYARFYSSSTTSCTASSCLEDCYTKIKSDMAFRIKLFD